jgi:cation transport ATPase
MINGMAAPKDIQRRRFGMIFLIVASAMVVFGQTVLSPLLRGLVFILYWLACFVITGLAMLAALLEARTISRQAREQHREMVARALDGLEDARPNAKPPVRTSGEQDAP